ncbi:cerebellar degeneration-related protein 2-like [Notechis scutatus]|uniref:Cerebellar degeneration-related protein 2-like n=1 Tax=Notechis scutatus TaxID=8663 RepID=A0A6J1V4Z5_9SAUR|nr:cerebellar degeneration-related protein 2-like [Notechis scutatus]
MSSIVGYSGEQHWLDQPSILKKTQKQTEPLEDLSATNKSLRLQIEELRGTLACLDAENHMFLQDKNCIKEQQKSLRDTVDCLKSTIEHLQKTVEDIRERLEHANTVIQELALQNKSLMKTNEELNEEIHEATSQVAFFKDDKPAEENNLEEMRNLPSEVQKYLHNLEDKLAKTEHSYHVERIHLSQLKEKVTNLQAVRENRRKHIKELQDQQDLCVQQAMLMRLDQEKQRPTGVLMHEQVEARLVGDRSKERKVLHWLWMVAKILMMFLFGCSLFLGLVLVYTRFINPLFISDSLLVLLSDQSINRLVHHFSLYLEWRNDGLLPF